MAKNNVIGDAFSLSSLRDKRAALLNDVKLVDDAIKALELLDKSGIINGSLSSVTNERVNDTGLDLFQSGRGDLSGLTVVDATIKVLKRRGTPLKIRDILDEFDKGGKKINAKNVFTNVYSTISRASKTPNAKIEKLQDGLWGLVN